jgi:hypothetical protein
MGVNPGVKFYALQGNVENDAIPYVEPGGFNSEARLNLRNGPADMFVALNWSSGQGRLTSTGLHIYIEDEEGDDTIVNNQWPISQSTSSVLNPHLTIEEWKPYGDPDELYQVMVNSSPQLGFYGFPHGHGAENFILARVISVTQNDSSAVPGGFNDHENFTNVRYTSQFGTANFTSQTKIRGALYGDASFGSASTDSWDGSCAAP